jgi:hypothetical protein
MRCHVKKDRAMSKLCCGIHSVTFSTCFKAIISQSSALSYSFSASSDYLWGERGSIVVKALCCTLKDRGFDSRNHWVYLIYLMLPAALGPGVYSASNRNEYQKQKNIISGGVKSSRCVRLTILEPSVSRLSRQCGIFNIS